MAGFTQKTIDLIKGILFRRQEKGGMQGERYVLVFPGMPEDTFTVVKWFDKGALNEGYHAESIIVTRQSHLDINEMLLSKIFACIDMGEGKYIPYSGILVEMEAIRKVDEYYFYRVVIVPKVWLLTQSRGNRIFLDKTIPEILEAVLIDGGLMQSDFEFRLKGDHYRKWEYICQYSESHFDFLVRWLEYSGMYFFHEGTDEGEKLVITDTKIAHTYSPFATVLNYRPTTGLESGHWDETLSAFSVCYAGLPKSVSLKDYNYRRPSLDLTGKADVHAGGAGEIFLYGEHFQTPEEGNLMAKIRAEEISCRRVVFRGESRAPFLRQGILFEVKGHYEEQYNGLYMITGIEHHGNQAIFLTAGLRREFSDSEQEPVYRNTFTAIPADVQYRPPRITPKKRFYGVINAHIDAESSGEYAEVDSQGRYKVVLPFDLSGRGGGKASAWFRMAQPYTGSNHGMHFPLHKGTEVLLTFIDGDPDRPIIAGAVPNPDTPSVLNDSNATRAGFVTAGGGAVVADDTAGKEEITLKQGDDAGFKATGNGLGGGVGIWGNYAWHYAGMGAVALTNLFSFDAGASTYIRSIGFKKELLFYLNGLMAACRYAPELLPSGKLPSDPPSLSEKIEPFVALALDLVAYWLIEKSVKARVKAHNFAAPNIGYGIYADDKGAITYMKAPWTVDNPDIALISATGQIDIVAGRNSQTWAENKLTLAAGEEVSILSSTVEMNAGKINIKSNRQGVNIDSTTDGVKIGTTLGNILIKSEAGPITLSHVTTEGNATGTIVIDSTGNITLRQPSGRITFQTGDTKMTMSAAGLVEVTASHGLTIEVDKSKVEVEMAGITISSPYEVKINELTVTKTDLAYKGKSASIANVLKVKA